MSVNVSHLRTLLDSCIARDRRRLEDRLRSASSGPNHERDLARLADEINASVRRRQRRAELAPRPAFPEDLPVVARRAEIASAIAANQVVVICGETGSGKTTQLPKICLELGRGAAGLIGHTQPRRLAARSVAARIAQELGTPLGQTVGFKVRFGDHTGPDTLVKIMTDGILLAETRGDRLLEAYDTIIIDEAHERSLNIDFLLGYLRQLLPRRPDLKIIITSATIDPQRFSAHFGNAPVIEVSGRTYPVEIRYRPLVGEEGTDRDLERGILDALGELEDLDRDRRMPGRGDVLVFLSGEREIRETADAIRQHAAPNTEVVPLYARLSAAEQMRVFQPHVGRRIVLATNVAETSLTVPGIRYVIDAGEARISRYNARSKVQRLPVEAISRASANQRAGRCGRVEAGVCIRLYSEEDFSQRPEFTDPEILRTNLAGVILQMKSLRLGPPEEFPFVEPPDSRAIRDGYETLRELQAVDDKGELTRLGEQLARLPIDPRLGRMMIEAHRENALSDVLVLAAAMSIQDPRERPMDAQPAADQAHAPFKNTESDALGLLTLWKLYHDQGRHLGSSRFRKWCREHFLSFTRMREWTEVRQQLDALATEMGMRPTHHAADPGAIHRAMLAGFLSNIGCKSPETGEYAGARGSVFHIFPGSGLFKKGPRWVVAAEIVQTTKLYARTVCTIQPEWIERLAPHVVRKSHSDPHWDAKSGQVLAFERVTLFGLELVARRLVPLGPIDPSKARELFIHHALVEGEMRTRGSFLEQNQRAKEEIERLQAKARRTDLLSDARSQFSFYDTRVPKNVHSTATFEAWRTQAERRDPHLLLMKPADLLVASPTEFNAADYPDRAPLGENIVPIDYIFDPNDRADGVTLTVPVELLGQTDGAGAEGLVPSLYRERAAALVRTLPKSIRKYIADDAVREAADAARRSSKPLTESLAAELAKRVGVTVTPKDFRPESLPANLNLNFRIVDSSGQELAQGRDLEAIRRELAPRIRSGLELHAGTQWTRDRLTDWDCGDLPEHVPVTRGRMTLRGFPALTDQSGSASLRLFDSADAARNAMPAGLRRLLAAHAKDEIRHQIRVMPTLSTMTLHYAPIGTATELQSDLAALIADRAFLVNRPTALCKRDFEAIVQAGWNRITPAARETAALIAPLLAQHHAVRLRIVELAAPAFAPALDDVRSQLSHLTPTGFLLSTPPGHLDHFPRYLRAIDIRLQRLARTGLDRDARARSEVQPWWHRYTQLLHADPARSGRFVEFRWLLEEWRVSLFAQELGTAGPVSAKRIDEAWRRCAGD